MNKLIFPNNIHSPCKDLQLIENGDFSSKDEIHQSNVSNSSTSDTKNGKSKMTPYTYLNKENILQITDEVRVLTVSNSKPDYKKNLSYPLRRRSCQDISNSKHTFKPEICALSSESSNRQVQFSKTISLDTVITTNKPEDEGDDYSSLGSASIDSEDDFYLVAPSRAPPRRLNCDTSEPNEVSLLWPSCTKHPPLTVKPSPFYITKEKPVFKLSKGFQLKPRNNQIIQSSRRTPTLFPSPPSSSVMNNRKRCR